MSRISSEFLSRISWHNSPWLISNFHIHELWIFHWNLELPEHDALEIDAVKDDSLSEHDALEIDAFKDDSQLDDHKSMFLGNITSQWANLQGMVLNYHNALRFFWILV